MPYTRREFHTNNKQIQGYFDTLMKDLVVEMPPMLAQEISRHKTIQNIRNMDRKHPYIIISRDQKYHISLIKIRPPVKLLRRGDKFIFSLDGK